MSGEKIEGGSSSSMVGSHNMARSIDSVRSQTSASAGRSDYKSVALSAAWGAEGTGNADFGPAWKFLSADPQAINDQDEQGRTILHCCCALPDDAGRAVLLNNLLAAGADPRVEDKYGWSPSESDFVLEAEDKWNAWKHRFTDKDLKFLLERGSCKLTSLRVQQALWFCCNRHNVNARFEVRGGVKDQTPLHLIVQCIPSSLDQSKNQQKQKDKPIQELQPLSQAMAKDRLDKWSAKKALLQMRNQLERKGVPVEEWTNIHELLCLVLDLGANAELLDGDKRKASHYSASESVRALLESDWELGEKTREGSTLTENGDVVSATGIVVEENAIEGGDSGAGLPNIQDDLESVSSHFARLSVDLISRDVEEEGLFKRVERAEKELREWRKVNKLGLSEEVKRWPYEDALKNFDEWAKEGHPARRTRALTLELVQPALNHHRPSANKKQREEEEEGTVEEILAEKEEEAEYVLEYEFETI